MSEPEPAMESHDPLATSDFGLFFPVGYLVAAFPERAGAQRVQSDLLAGGYDAADCRLSSGAQMAAAAERNLATNSSFWATLGRSDEMVKEHLAAGRHGATFLLIYAPGDTEAQRAMNVIRRVPFEFVHRYHRLSIEEME